MKHITEYQVSESHMQGLLPMSAEDLTAWKMQHGTLIFPGKARFMCALPALLDTGILYVNCVKFGGKIAVITFDLTGLIDEVGYTHRRHFSTFSYIFTYDSKILHSIGKHICE